jgi:hypothetical protein
MRSLLLCTTLLLVLPACAPPRAKPPATTNNPNPPPAIVAEATVLKSPKTTSSVKEVADQFLSSLSKGEAKTSLLTDDFKKRIALPRNDEEKKLGYSDSVVQSWLDKDKGLTFKKEAESSLQSNDYTVIGSVTGGSKPEFFVLRYRMLPGKTPEVNWFHRSTVRSSDRTNAQPASPDLEAARDFLEVACGGEPVLTASLLSPDFKAKLAPPFDSEKGIGYNPSLLNLKMKSWQATSFKLVPGEVGNFTGELTQVDKKVSFSLKVGNFAGTWLVENYEVK